MKIKPIKPRSPAQRAMQLVLVPVIAALLAVAGVAASCVGSSSHTSSRDQRNFSARPVMGPESIQLSPCQRSAAACFESGGLGTLTENLDGLSINRDTGRFCFSFQDGCERR